MENQKVNKICLLTLSVLCICIACVIGFKFNAVADEAGQEWFAQEENSNLNIDNNFTDSAINEDTTQVYQVEVGEENWGQVQLCDESEEPASSVSESFDIDEGHATGAIAIPAPGYEFDHWEFNVSSGANVNYWQEEDCVFMSRNDDNQPWPSSDLLQPCIAHFKQSIPKVNIHGTVKDENGTPLDYAYVRFYKVDNTCELLIEGYSQSGNYSYNLAKDNNYLIESYYMTDTEASYYYVPAQEADSVEVNFVLYKTFDEPNHFVETDWDACSLELQTIDSKTGEVKESKPLTSNDNTIDALHTIMSYSYSGDVLTLTDDKHYYDPEFGYFLKIVAQPKEGYELVDWEITTKSSQNSVVNAEGYGQLTCTSVIKPIIQSVQPPEPGPEPSPTPDPENPGTSGEVATNGSVQTGDYFAIVLCALAVLTIAAGGTIIIRKRKLN